MSTLKVANIHFEATGTNRVEYVANNINFRTGGGNFTISVGGAESLNVNASSVMISGANILASVAAAATTANNAVQTTRNVSAGGIATGGGDLSADRTITVTKATGAEITTGTDDTHAVTAKAMADAGIGPPTSAILNYVPDGNVEICQPGNTYSLANTAAWNVAGPDMFMAWATGTAVSAGTVSQDTSALVGRTGNALKIAGATITGTGKAFMRTRISARDAVKLKNATGGFAVRVRHDVGSNIDVVVTISKATVADNFSSVTSVATSTTSVATGTDTLISLAAQALGDVSNGIQLEIEFRCGAVTTKNFWTTEWWLYEGSTLPAAYPRAEFSQVLLRVQQYRQRTYAYGTATAAVTTLGMEFTQPAVYTGSWTYGYFKFSFRPHMRAAPTVTIYDQLGNSGKVDSIFNTSRSANQTPVTASQNITTTGFETYPGPGGGSYAGSGYHYDADARP